MNRLPPPAASLALLLAALPAAAQDLPRGQELFQQQCLACHHNFQQPYSRHLQSLDDLKKKISSWATHSNTGWGDKEVNDVLLYLNRSFYKFPEKVL
jgi:mono/diheme cytochrome c family protein